MRLRDGGEPTGRIQSQPEPPRFRVITRQLKGPRMAYPFANGHIGSVRADPVRWNCRRFSRIGFERPPRQAVLAEICDVKENDSIEDDDEHQTDLMGAGIISRLLQGGLLVPSTQSLLGAWSESFPPSFSNPDCRRPSSTIQTVKRRPHGRPPASTRTRS